MGSPACHYEVLGVAPDAPIGEIRKRYLDLARRVHPDLTSNPPGSVDPPGARMRDVNAAWETLGDSKRRAAYDRARRGGTGSTDPSAGGSGEGRAASASHDAATFDLSETDLFETDHSSAEFDEEFGEEFAEAGSGGAPAGWLVMAAPGTLVVGLLTVLLGAVTAVEFFVVAGMVTLCVSAGLFSIAALTALAASRRADRRR